MRRRIGLLTVTTWLVLTGAVVTAAPAGARNVGGTVPADAICLTPGQAQARSARADAALECLCYIVPLRAPAPGGRNVGGNEPAGETNCPPGILKQQDRSERNMGG